MKTKNNKTKLKILVVDDHEVTLLAEYSLLTSLEALEVLTANSSGKALNLVDDTFDLVLTDIEMPDQNGDQLAKTIHQKHPFLPIVGITAMADEQRQTVYMAHLERLLHKPLKIKDCQKLIKDLKAKNFPVTKIYARKQMVWPSNCASMHCLNQIEQHYRKLSNCCCHISPDEALGHCDDLRRSFIKDYQAYEEKVKASKQA